MTPFAMSSSLMTTALTMKMTRILADIFKHKKVAQVSINVKNAAPITSGSPAPWRKKGDPPLPDEP